MNKKIARRTLLRSLGAAAVAGGTSCEVAPYRVNLICQGSMMFHFKPNDRQENNFIHILVPYPPPAGDDPAGTHPPHPGHSISLSDSPGTADNRLLPYKDKASNTNPHYTLDIGEQFTWAASKFYPPIKQDDGSLVFDPLTGSDRLVLYDSKYPLYPADCAYIIKVPYPSNVYLHDVVDYSGCCPYKPSVSNTGFKLDERFRGSAGVHILSWDQVTKPVVLTKPDNSPIEFKVKPEFVNLYLYSQMPETEDYRPGHIIPFNCLVTYNGKPLDLAPKDNPMSHIAYTEPTAIDNELKPVDLASLPELNNPAQAAEEHIKVINNLVDCVIGYGT